MSIKDLKNLSEDEARKLLEGVLWPNGPVCPHCGNCDATRIGHVAANPAKKVRAGLKQCKECRKQFTVTVNTVFASSKLPISTWLYIIASMCASKKGISALQLQREFGSKNYEAFWFACHRVRHAMSDLNPGGMLGGQDKVLEADETWVGGKPRFKGTRQQNTVYSNPNKTPVVTLVERDGSARTIAVANVDAFTLRNHLTKHGNPASRLMTDEHKAYGWSGKFFVSHESVNHRQKEYARGDVFSNTAESYFAILKRSIYGIHHHYSREHLGLYLSERDLVWSTKKMNDAERTLLVLKKSEGKRLMYKRGKSSDIV